MTLARVTLLAAATILSAQQMEEPVLRVTVRLVQIDAVVTNKHGKNVPDLTRDDFKLYQDGKEQAITHFSYIEAGGGTSSPAPSARRVTAPGPRVAAPPVPLVREATRRTLALVVDDLGLSIQSVPNVKAALRKFVDEQMGSSDAAAILRTRSGSGTLQQFTNDKRLLHMAIDRVRWNGLGRAGADPIGTLDEDENRQDQASQELPSRVKPQTLREFERARAQAYTMGTLGALHSVIEQLRDMPGRKSVILFSDSIQLFVSAEDARYGNPIPGRLRALVDLASRAGVVFYTIDARGLQYLGVRAGDNVRGARSIAAKLEQRNRDFREKQEGMAYLARETGGLFFSETNDLATAARQAMQDQSGYYLIGYSPDEGTFAKLGGEAKYHRLKLRVTRAGLNVRTRTGFVGVADRPARPLPDTPQQQLLTALTSPFQSGGMGLRLTPLFCSAPGKGSFIHTLLHIDGRQLTFVEDGDQFRKATLDIAVAAFNESGASVAPKAQTFEIRLPRDQVAQTSERGFVFEMMYPVDTPGPYQIRAAARDVASKKVGSAAQFQEVPDLRRGQLALSGIEMRSAASPDPAVSSAVRRFAPGAPLTYAFTVFHPKAAPQDTAEIQAHVFRDGRVVWAGEPHALDTGKPEITVMRDLRFGSDTPEGAYMLRIAARRFSQGKVVSTAVEWIDFELSKAARQ